MTRPALAVVAAVAVAGLGGMLLGEYRFGGLAVVGAGLLLGLFVAEAALAVSKERAWWVAGVCAAASVGGLLLGAWIATGHRLATVPGEGWLAFPAGAVAALLRARPRSRPAGSPGDPVDPADPAPTP